MLNYTRLFSFAIVMGLISPAASALDKVAFQVLLNGVKEGSAPLYVSVQDANLYRTQQGNAGTIIRQLDSQQLTVDLEVEPGEYAISIWHDLDEDGAFSMGKDYIPTDGWGASGTPPTDRAPSFEDVKVGVRQAGQVMSIDMIYNDQ